eukprot:jgi/Botrbrau1/18873/Bobra.177_2s0033.1
MRATTRSSVPPPPAPRPPSLPPPPPGPGGPPAPDAGTGTYGFQAGPSAVPSAVSEVSYMACSSSGTVFNLKAGQYSFHASADDAAGNHGQSPEVILTVGYDVGSGASSNQALLVTLGSAAAGAVILLILCIFMC